MESKFYHLLPVWPYTYYLSSLCLSFPTVEKWVVVLVTSSYGFCDLKVILLIPPQNVNQSEDPCELRPKYLIYLDKNGSAKCG